MTMAMSKKWYGAVMVCALELLCIIFAQGAVEDGLNKERRSVNLEKPNPMIHPAIKSSFGGLRITH